MEEQIFQERTDLTALSDAVASIRNEIKKIIVGQDEMVKLIITALLADGHVLIEGVPGVAKTLTAKLVAKSVEAGFSRIQFTPDLMPSDVLGTPVFNPKDAVFEFRKGPIFSNVILVDEINRAPAKTQSALLEIMEERQATIDGKTYPMASPFMVLATQNPVEQEGTYRLPEAQLDRFLFKITPNFPILYKAGNPNAIPDAKSLSATKILLTIIPSHTATELPPSKIPKGLPERILSLVSSIYPSPPAPSICPIKSSSCFARKNPMI